MWSEAWTPASGEDGKPHGFHADMLAVKSALCNRAMTFISHSEAKSGKRGKVLRDPHAGPGILIVEGRQYRFWLDGSWNSDVPPKPGLAVDVIFSAQGQIQEITVVSEAVLERAHTRKGPGWHEKPHTLLSLRRWVKTHCHWLPASLCRFRGCRSRRFRSPRLLRAGQTSPSGPSSLC